MVYNMVCKVVGLKFVLLAYENVMWIKKSSGNFRVLEM